MRGSDPFGPGGIAGADMGDQLAVVPIGLGKVLAQAGFMAGMFHKADVADPAWPSISARS